MFVCITSDRYSFAKFKENTSEIKSEMTKNRPTHMFAMATPIAIHHGGQV